MSCSCPDWAVLCKHVAAVLYGIGARLDLEPQLLFLLRDVDHTELVGEAVSDANLDNALTGTGDALVADDLGAMFGIELDSADSAASKTAKRGRRTAKGAAASASKAAKKTKAVKAQPAVIVEAKPVKKSRSPLGSRKAAGGRVSSSAPPDAVVEAIGAGRKKPTTRRRARAR
jgi:uncharacterized Zn finger protein